MVVQWIAQESTSPNKENVPTQLFLDANGNHKEPESTNGPLHDDLIKSKGHPSTSQGHDPGRSDTDEGQLVRPADTFISDGEEDRTCAATLRKQESKECCPLGTDLLRMFHNGLDVDVTLEAQGKQFKAHRYDILFVPQWCYTMFPKKYKKIYYLDISTLKIMAWYVFWNPTQSLMLWCPPFNKALDGNFCCAPFNF